MAGDVYTGSLKGGALKILNIRNIRALERGDIECEVMFEGMDEYAPYLATSTDSAATGQQIWLELHNGKWGDIAPFVVTPEMLAAARAAKRLEINRWRDIQENLGVIFELGGHRWDGGMASQERLAPVVSVARTGMLPEGFFWTDADNHDVPADSTLLEQLRTAMMQAMVMQGFKIHERQRQMKEELSTLETLNEINNFSVGWSVI